MEIIMALMNTNTLRYDMSGRKRKAKPANGDTYTKLKRAWQPMESSPKPFVRGEGVVYRSVELGSPSVCTAPEKKTYTGTLIKGIATMHKSNAVPIINQQEATDIANMRRN